MPDLRNILVNPDAKILSRVSRDDGKVTTTVNVSGLLCQL